MPRTSTARHRVVRLEIDSDCARIEPLVTELTRDPCQLGWLDEQGCYEVTLALTEALANAILHGNLEIASDVREGGIGAMLALAERRRREEPYASRRVHVDADLRPDKLVYVIEDDGPGFDRASLPPPDACSADCLSGRGLLLIHAYMNGVEHNARGNRITLTKYLTRRAAPGADHSANGNGAAPRRTRAPGKTRIAKSE
jgi:anti-sigma regulatory factor (Ser/Thr protein kinase)